MAVFFTSDTHFGHTNIIKYCNRPFDSIKEMDDTFTDNINQMVSENDTLWHLGDFAFGIYKNYVNICKQYRDRINCKNVHITWGNHDQPKKIKHLFGIADYVKPSFKHEGYKFYLNHYAPAIWYKSHRGQIALYGHSHANAEEKLDKMMPGRRSMDVGVDNAYILLGEYRPFTFDEVIEIMDQKSGCALDHHTGERE